MSADQPTARELTVESGGDRLDSFLAGGSPGLTRSQLRRLIDGGSILLNGRPAQALAKGKARRPGVGVGATAENAGPGPPVNAP